MCETESLYDRALRANRAMDILALRNRRSQHYIETMRVRLTEFFRDYPTAKSRERTDALIEKYCKKLKNCYRPYQTMGEVFGWGVMRDMPDSMWAIPDYTPEPGEEIAPYV